MCPKPLMLSAHFDGELAEPLKSTVTAHIGCCPACQASLRQLQKMSNVLRQSPALPESSLSSRGGRIGIRAGTVDATQLQRFWRYVSIARFEQHSRMRFVSVPLPVLVAASSILFLVIVLSFLQRPSPSLDELVETENQTSAVLTINLSPKELEDLLESMEEKFNNGIQIVHQMPDQIPVIRFGEPQILRTASIEREY